MVRRGTTEVKLLQIKTSGLKYETQIHFLYLEDPETGLRRRHKVDKQYENQQIIKLKLPSGILFGSQSCQILTLPCGVEGWGVVGVGVRSWQGDPLARQEASEACCQARDDILSRVWQPYSHPV